MRKERGRGREMPSAAERQRCTSPAAGTRIQRQKEVWRKRSPGKVSGGGGGVAQRTLLPQSAQPRNGGRRNLLYQVETPRGTRPVWAEPPAGGRQAVLRGLPVLPLLLPAGRFGVFKDSKAAGFPSPRPSFSPSSSSFFNLVLALVLSAHPLLESSEAFFFLFSAGGGELEDRHVSLK